MFCTFIYHVESYTVICHLTQMHTGLGKMVLNYLHQKAELIMWLVIPKMFYLSTDSHQSN